MSFELKTGGHLEAPEGDRTKEFEVAKVLILLAEKASGEVEEQLRFMILRDKIPVATAVSLIAQRVRDIVFGEGCRAFSVGDGARRQAVEALNTEPMDEPSESDR